MKLRLLPGTRKAQGPRHPVLNQKLVKPRDHAWTLWSLHWLPVLSLLGFGVDVADASFLVTVQRFVEILLGVLGALRMVIERVGVAMPSVPSAFWEALLCRHCPASLSDTNKI